jgi:hypothetical protein
MQLGMYGTRQYLGRMKVGKKGGEDSLGLVIDSETGEFFCLAVSKRD